VGRTTDGIAQSSIVSYGVTAATFSWEGGHDEQALGTIVQLTPKPWLTLGAIPTLLRVSGDQDSNAHTGLTDLPVFAGVVHNFTAPWHPAIGLAGVASLPTGNASQGLGRGESLISAEGTVSVLPLPILAVRAGASRLLRTGDSVPHGISTTTVFGDAVFLATARTNVSLGYALELRGDAPAAYDPARAINATVVHTFLGRTALSFSAGRTLSGVGPQWSFALGLGTAFAGLSPIGATSPSARSTGGVTRPVAGGLLPILP
jgi:hypothetical protein